MINIENGRYWDLPWSLVSGCTPCSLGCDHCWSAAMTHRFADRIIRQTGEPLIDSSGNFTGCIATHTERLSIPLKRRKPTVYAVWNDLFHEDVPDKFIAKVFQVINGNPRHTFLLLTKRPKRIRDFVLKCGSWSGYVTHNGNAPLGFGGDGLIVGQEKEPITDGNRYEERATYWPPPNLWSGLTVVNRQEADEKIPVFLQVPGGNKFLSIEPMLGPIDINIYCMGFDNFWDPEQGGNGLVRLSDPGIHSVILGGETGPGARPMHPDWVRSVRDQCQSAGVPFFFKQWGNPSAQPINDRHHAVIAGIEPGLRNGGRLLDGRTHDDLPWVRG